MICRGKQELEDETPAQTELLFREVIKDVLKVDNSDAIMFRAVHRLPKPTTGHGSTQPKPIIAAFIMQQDRDMCLFKANLLKDSGLSLQSHLPKQLNDQRNAMLKERRRMMNADSTRKLRIVDRNFKPCFQEKLPGADKFTTVKFPIQDQQDADVRPQRRGRSGQVNHTA